MARYPEDIKEAIIGKMVPPPANDPVFWLMKQAGMTGTTVHIWRKKTRNQGVSMRQQSSARSVRDRFTVLVESAAMNTTELS